MVMMLAIHDARLKALRQQAERALEGHEGTAEPCLRDALELLSELKVYQEELRIQNEELRRTQKDLADAQALYFDLFNLSPVAIVRLDRSGHVVDANRAATALLSSGRALTGLGMVSMVEDGDLGQFNRHYESAVGAESCVSCEVQLTNQRPVELHTVALQPDDRVRGYLTALVDTSERRAAELARLHLEQQLLEGQKMQAIGLLAGGIAHDFNNILQAVFGHVDLTLRRMGDEDPLRDSLTAIRNSADRAARLTRQLLAFGGKQLLRRGSFDLNSIVQEMLDMLGRLIGEHITIDWKPGNGLQPVHVDRSQIEQVVMNLVLNARDAMPKGGTITLATCSSNVTPAVGVARGLDWSGTGAQLSVADSGEGMDEETLARVFEPFFSRKPKEKGTGLGLATVYGIVRQHRGAIWAESSPARGSTFTILLPPAAVGPAETSQQAPLKEPAGGSETILVAEDEDEVRELVESLLTDVGYRVLTARDGMEALAQFEAHFDDLDLVILDAVMPKLSGPDVCHEILRRRPGLKVLFSTGYGADVIDAQELESGTVTVIQKPYRRAVFLSTVRRVLDA